MHVVTTKKSYNGWVEFQRAVTAAAQRAPERLEFELIEDEIKELLQTFPWKPFALGRSIGVEQLKGTGTMGGYVVLKDRAGGSVC